MVFGVAQGPHFSLDSGRPAPAFQRQGPVTVEPRDWLFKSDLFPIERRTFFVSWSSRDLIRRRRWPDAPKETDKSDPVPAVGWDRKVEAVWGGGGGGYPALLSILSMFEKLAI